MNSKCLNDLLLEHKWNVKDKVMQCEVVRYLDTCSHCTTQWEATKVLENDGKDSKRLYIKRPSVSSIHQTMSVTPLTTDSHHAVSWLSGISLALPLACYMAVSVSAWYSVWSEKFLLIEEAAFETCVCLLFSASFKFTLN